MVNCGLAKADSSSRRPRQRLSSRRQELDPRRAVEIPTACRFRESFFSKMRFAMNRSRLWGDLLLVAGPVFGFPHFANHVAGNAPPPVPPNPQAPPLGIPVPLGMQRGTTLDLTLTGTNLAEPTRFWTSFPAKVTIP